MHRARLLSDQRGAAIVEMIIVLPLLLVVLFGIVELSRAWLTFQVATAAVREGARAAAVASQSLVSTAGTARIDALLAAGGVTAVSRSVTLQSLSCGTPPCDSAVVADVTVQFQTLFPLLLPSLIGTMQQTTQMRYEGS